MKIGILLAPAFLLASTIVHAQAAPVPEVIERVRLHDFNQVRDGFTYDRRLDKHGVASLEDSDWKIRTLAVRDLVRAKDPAAIIKALDDDNSQVRYLAAMAIGIRLSSEAVPALERLLGGDADSTVRSQAAIALGQIGEKSSLGALQAAQADAKDRDVTHQAEIAIHAIKTSQTATPELAKAFALLDESTFSQAKVGQAAPDFTLPDTEGRVWTLSDLRGKQAVALIWIFADWCPVCHGEFNELIELKNAFKEAGIQPITVECHDLLPARVMVGEELTPKYWFAKESFREKYSEQIWWPHLVDRAAIVGVNYGVQPMAFAVHSEFINRPTVALIDKEGIHRFLYQGTFWGDRPFIHQILEMLKSDDYQFAAPKRLVPVPAD